LMCSFCWSNHRPNILWHHCEHWRVSSDFLKHLLPTDRKWTTAMLFPTGWRHVPHFSSLAHPYSRNIYRGRHSKQKFMAGWFPRIVFMWLLPVGIFKRKSVREQPENDRWTEGKHTSKHRGHRH
jgi:hypothetical protein